ncbi:MAG: hypothetical protein COA78_19215 [Blastopirellula sp.]|nr:MAG: hypothetical protein COA78_19215 [Blastopirellula sp.]
MTDLQSKKLIYLKGFLFLIILLSCSGLIVYETRSWKITLLLALAIWASARVYYFMFYVIQRYVDPGYKFAGIYSFVMYLFSRGKK